MKIVFMQMDADGWKAFGEMFQIAGELVGDSWAECGAVNQMRYNARKNLALMTDPNCFLLPDDPDEKECVLELMPRLAKWLAASDPCLQ